MHLSPVVAVLLRLERAARRLPSLRRFRRARIRARPFPGAWLRVVERNVPLYGLDPASWAAPA